MVRPNREEFLGVAHGRKYALVWDESPGDIETPLSAYWKLAHDQEASFLLESVTGGEQLARYSVIGIRPSRIVAGNIGQDHDPLAEAFHAVPFLECSVDDALPKFIGGAVGTLSYDYVRAIENLPWRERGELDPPDVAMMVARLVVVFDHVRQSIITIAIADADEEGYTHASGQIQWVRERLESQLPPLPKISQEEFRPTTDRSGEQFMDDVRFLVGEINRGECIQVVPSVRFSVACSAHPVNVYRKLRSINPSPYMFLLRFGDMDVVGASPELLVGLEGDMGRVRPIAGTRPRGTSLAEDTALAAGLLADEKERAEHIMLVDLGRNDLGKVSVPGSVTVGDLMVIERYSHVMHIVSSVTGKLRPGMTAIDLVRACFPAGTVSGAPKVRAMELIDRVESHRRGLYGGAVGYLGATGDLDLAIAIRTIYMTRGQAHVQAGAGIVSDSDPQSEWQEVQNKARACLDALRLAMGQ